MMHAENHDMTRWIAHRLLERGHVGPKFQAVAHDTLAESEATNRAIALAGRAGRPGLFVHGGAEAEARSRAIGVARLAGVPVLIVHVAGRETVEVIRNARRLGAAVYAESCPQYLFLEASDSDLPGMEGAKFCCSPPPRDADAQEAVWAGLQDGTLGLYSSDNAPSRFDA